MLDIEIMQFKIAGFQQVGAVMTASEKGIVVHPETDDEDMKTISNLLGGNIEAATINGGIPFVSSGILAMIQRSSCWNDNKWTRNNDAYKSILTLDSFFTYSNNSEILT